MRGANYSWLMAVFCFTPFRRRNPGKRLVSGIAQPASVTDTIEFLPERRAVVCVAGYVTRYVRRGTGRPVVVLAAPGDVDALWPELLDAIAARHRLIMPEVPAQEAGFGSWLRGFLEGVGLPAAAIIAVGPCCLPAVEVALLDTERLARLVLIPSGSADETGLTGMLGTTGRSSALPVLVLRRAAPVEQALRLVQPFLLAAPP